MSKYNQIKYQVKVAEKETLNKYQQSKIAFPDEPITYGRDLKDEQSYIKK